MLEQMIQEYKAQTLKIFKMANPNYEKALGTSNDMQLFHAEDGLFADCAIEAQVTNVTFNPIATLANMIPVVPTVHQKLRFAFLTSIADPSGTLPATPCDDSQEIGDVDACFAEFRLGRISFQTKTGEIDSLVNVAHGGIRTDLYLVGRIRGVSAPISAAQANDRDFVSRAAVRRQMSLLGRAIQNETIKQFWNGDPTNSDLNTVGGGAKQFWGLNYLIADDYDDKPFVDGTDCSKLNSDVKTLADGCFNTGDQDLYGALSTLEATIFNRALLMGLVPYEAVIVMNPILWQGIVEALPVQMLTNYGNAVANGVPVSLELSGTMSVAFMRQQLMNTMTIPVNGRTYTVILDAAIPVTINTTDPENIKHISTIYYVPLKVGGENVLYWQHKDYSQFDEMLAPIPNTMDMKGWTDKLSSGGALYHYAVKWDKRCFLVDVKTELGLVLTAPMLAGRIDNVTYCRLQAMEGWNTTTVVDD